MAGWIVGVAFVRRSGRRAGAQLCYGHVQSHRQAPEQSNEGLNEAQGTPPTPNKSQENNKTRRKTLKNLKKEDAPWLVLRRRDAQQQARHGHVVTQHCQHQGGEAEAVVHRHKRARQRGTPRLVLLVCGGQQAANFRGPFTCRDFGLNPCIEA